MWQVIDEWRYIDATYFPAIFGTDFNSIRICQNIFPAITSNMWVYTTLDCLQYRTFSVISPTNNQGNPSFDRHSFYRFRLMWQRYAYFIFGWTLKLDGSL